MIIITGKVYNPPCCYYFVEPNIGPQINQAYSMNLIEDWKKINTTISWTVSGNK